MEGVREQEANANSVIEQCRRRKEQGALQSTQVEERGHVEPNEKVRRWVRDISPPDPTELGLHPTFLKRPVSPGLKKTGSSLTATLSQRDDPGGLGAVGSAGSHDWLWGYKSLPKPKYSTGSPTRSPQQGGGGAVGGVGAGHDTGHSPARTRSPHRTVSPRSPHSPQPPPATATTPHAAHYTSTFTSRGERNKQKTTTPSPDNDVTNAGGGESNTRSTPQQQQPDLTGRASPTPAVATSTNAHAGNKTGNNNSTNGTRESGNSTPQPPAYNEPPSYQSLYSPPSAHQRSDVPQVLTPPPASPADPNTNHTTSTAESKPTHCYTTPPPQQQPPTQPTTTTDKEREREPKPQQQDRHSDATIQQLQHQLDRLSNENLCLTDKLTQMSELPTRYAQLQAENEKLKAENDALRKRVKHLEIYTHSTQSTVTNTPPRTPPPTTPTPTPPTLTPTPTPAPPPQPPGSGTPASSTVTQHTNSSAVPAVLNFNKDNTTHTHTNTHNTHNDSDETVTRVTLRTTEGVPVLQAHEFKGLAKYSEVLLAAQKEGLVPPPHGERYALLLGDMRGGQVDTDAFLPGGKVELVVCRKLCDHPEHA